MGRTLTRHAALVELIKSEARKRRQNPASKEDTSSLFRLVSPEDKVAPGKFFKPADSSDARSQQFAKFVAPFEPRPFVSLWLRYLVKIRNVF